MFVLEPNAQWDSLAVTQTWDRGAGDLDLVLTYIWHWRVHPSVCTAPFAFIACLSRLDVSLQHPPEVGAFQPQLEAPEAISMEKIIITVNLGR